MENKWVSLREIAMDIGSPEAFTAKILQALGRAGLVISTKGPNGGFHIPKEKLAAITVQDIIVALDGKSIYQKCGLGLEECSEERPCPIHDQYKVIRSAIKEMTSMANLYNLSKAYMAGEIFLTLKKQINKR